MPFAAPASNQTPLFNVVRVVIGGRRADREEPVNSITMRDVHCLRQERASQLDRTGAETSFSLVSAAGWTVSLLVSLGLWWGIWSAASSLVSALW
jgi:hypothetical protein